MFNSQIPSAVSCMGPATATAVIVFLLAGLQHRELLDALTDDHPDLHTEESVELAKVGLSQYFAGAVVMPDGRTYLWMAKSVRGRSSGFGHPVAEFAIGLGCDISEAPHLVYSQGLNLDPSSAAEIGPGCRVCPREHCVQRAFPARGQDFMRQR